MRVAEWVARLSVRIGARSADPRVVAFTLTSTASGLPRTPGGMAIARRFARDASWQLRYVAALVIGECCAIDAAHETFVALASDEHALVRAALARGAAKAPVSVDEIATLGPGCVRIARHAQIRRDYDARQPQVSERGA